MFFKFPVLLKWKDFNFLWVLKQINILNYKFYPSILNIKKKKNLYRNSGKVSAALAIYSLIC